VRNSRPNVLFIVHSWGGGTIRFARELAYLVADRVCGFSVPNALSGLVAYSDRLVSHSGRFQDYTCQDRARRASMRAA
jgi:hypothetical protein